MTLTLELPPERKAALKTQAESRGMSVEARLLEMTEFLAPSTSIAHMRKTDPKEWMRQFRGWAQGLDRTCLCFPMRLSAERASIRIAFEPIGRLPSVIGSSTRTFPKHANNRFRL